MKGDGAARFMLYRIHPLRSADESFLWEMLYQALYVPPGAPPFPPEIVRQPEISRYVAGWGQADDAGFVALLEETLELVGAVWIRRLQGAGRGYGYVDDVTPELTIALRPTARGQGVGTQLLAQMIAAARGQYPALSLSVSNENPARRLYQRFGFTVVEQHETSLTMKLEL
jgi:ribosomal protein S18 acetylase RimI-like enzyme